MIRNEAQKRQKQREIRLSKPTKKNGNWHTVSANYFINMFQTAKYTQFDLVNDAYIEIQISWENNQE